MNFECENSKAYKLKGYEPCASTNIKYSIFNAHSKISDDLINTQITYEQIPANKCLEYLLDIIESWRSTLTFYCIDVILFAWLGMALVFVWRLRYIIIFSEYRLALAHTHTLNRIEYLNNEYHI